MSSGIQILRFGCAIIIVACHLMLFPATKYAMALIHFRDTAVGFFAAISGLMLAMSVERGYIEYIRRRCARLLPPYIFWTVVYVVAGMLFHGVDSRYGQINYWAGVVVCGNASCHLWFIIILLYIQVLTYKIVRMGACCGRGVYLVVGLGLLALGPILPEWWAKYPVRMLAFYLTGYGLSTVKCESKIRRMVFVIGSMISLLAHVALSGVVHPYIRDWLVVFFVLPLILNVRVRLSERMKNVLSCSMGVYLVHPLFCAGIGVVIRRIFETPYGVVPIAIDWAVTSVLSLIAAAYLGKSKLLNRVVR